MLLCKNPSQAGEMFRMAVSSHCQGLGVGKQLVDTALHFAANYGYEEVILETSYSQQGAKAFYEKNGFTVYATHVAWHNCFPFYLYQLRYGFG